MQNAYKNYVKRYNEKAAVMKRHGTTMASDKMTFREYKMTRRAYVESGIVININQTIVSDQQYEFSLSAGRALKKYAEDMELSFAGESLISIRRGSAIRNESLSELNEAMKELADRYPKLYGEFASGTGRAKWIKDNIFWDVDSE